MLRSRAVFAVAALGAVLSPSFAAQAAWQYEFHGPYTIQFGPYQTSAADAERPRSLAPKSYVADLRPFVPTAEGPFPSVVAKRRQGWYGYTKPTAFEWPVPRANTNEMIAAPAD